MPPRRIRRPPSAPDDDRSAADHLVVPEETIFSMYEVDEQLTELVCANLPAGVYIAKRVWLGYGPQRRAII